VPEELYVRIVKEMGEGVTVSNDKGNFVVYNPKMEELTGYSKEEANNHDEKLFLDTLYPDVHLREKVANHINEIPVDGESNNIKTLITTKDRKKVHALVTSTSVRYKDKPYYLSVYRDISERPKVEA
jgi:PAS domain S-box-containing protein